MIDKNSPIPLYYQLKQILIQKIKEGALAPGSQLPTEQNLCETYEISRAPVRQALLELVRDGYIYRRAGSGTFVAQPAREEIEDVTVLRLLAYDVRWATLIQEAIRRWNMLHPEQRARLDVTMPAQEKFHQTLCTAVGGGNAPDLISIDYVWLTRYAQMGFLTAIDTLDPDFTARLQADIETPVLASHLLNGHLYGLPVQTDVTGLWYRRDWFAAAGLTPPQTWEEWRELLSYFARPEIKAQWGHQYPLAFPTNTHAGEATLNVLLSLIWSAGGAFQDASGAVRMNDPGVKQTLLFLQDTLPYLPPHHATLPWWGPAGMLAQGKVPMTLGGSYEWPTIAETATWDDERDLVTHLGFAPMPRPTLTHAPVLSLGGTAVALARQAEHQTLSLEIMKLALEPRALQAFFERELQISPFRSLNRRLACPEHPWLESIVPLLELAQVRPMLSEYVQFSRVVQLMFEEVLCEGVAVETAIRQTDKTLRLILAG